MVRAGALRDVSAIFGMHNEPGLPVGKFATRGGPFYANVDRFAIRITGKGAHAARPHEGNDAILLASQLVTALQSVASRNVNTLDSVVLSVTRIAGGNTWNVLPESVELEGTLRTHRTEVQQNVKARVGKLRPVLPVPLARRLISPGLPGPLRWSMTNAGPISPPRSPVKRGMKPITPSYIWAEKISQSISSLFPARLSASAATVRLVYTTRHLIRMKP
jgi:hypothetical protein